MSSSTIKHYPRLLIFIGIILFLSLGATYYLGDFIRQSGTWSQKASIILYALLWSIFPAFALTDQFRRRKQWGIPYAFGTIFLGSFSIAIATATVGYVALLLGSPPPLTVHIGIFVTGFLVLAALLTNALGPRITKIDLSQKPPFDTQPHRLTVVHLSDIHLSHHTRLSWVKSIVAKTNQFSPDLIVFTGDLIDVDPKHIPNHMLELSKLKAKFGKFAVSGNHDFMTGIHTFYNACKTLGFTCLDHQTANVPGLHLVGMPDELGHQHDLPPVHPPAPTTPVIFLKHRPTRFKEAVNAGIHLQLSGHSHKGQIPPWGLLVQLRYQKYAYGLHTYKTGHIFTTRGTGVWGPPMRLFGRSEITVFTL